MDDWVAFLNARLDDDERFLRTTLEVGERKAAEASDSTLMALAGPLLSMLSDPAILRTLASQVESGVPAPTDAKRLLREVKAKRAILADYLKAAGIVPDDYSEDPACTDALLTALGHQMAVWDDHPDYPAARKSLEEAYWTP